jgi:hypothetical protein
MLDKKWQKVACTVDRVGVGEHFDVITRYFGVGPTSARGLVKKGELETASARNLKLTYHPCFSK